MAGCLIYGRKGVIVETMENLKKFGLLAFVATGGGMLLTSFLNQTTPWMIVVVLVAVGYIFGLIQHWENLCS
jgi:hypothetical protein